MNYVTNITPISNETADAVIDQSSGCAQSNVVATSPASPPAPVIINPFAGTKLLGTGNLDVALDVARDAYMGAQGSAADAAARAFVVWYYCQSPVATMDMKEAYESRRRAMNKEIEAHNTKISDAVKAGKTRTADRKDELNKEIPTVNDPERKAMLEAELAGLEDKLKTTVDELRRDSWVQVDERDNALPFTETVKFTLRLIKRAQATQVNRYANAVGWINDTLFGGAALLAQSVPDAAVIAQKIVDAGGVEKVATTQREARRDQDEAEDRRLVAEAVVDTINNHVRNASPVAEASLDVVAEDGSVVALIARKSGKILELLKPLPMDDNEIEQMLAKHVDANELTGNAEAEFVGEMLAVAADINKAVMTCREGTKAFVVSFVDMQDGVPVIHAQPKGAAASILPPNGGVVMDEEQLAALRKRLGSPHERKLVGIDIAMAPGMILGKCPMPAVFAWRTEIAALVAKGRPSGTMLHPWVSFNSMTTKPHDVWNFVPVVSLKIDRTALVTLANGKLKAWEKDQSATKSKDVATLRYDGSDLTLEASKGIDQVPAMAINGQAGNTAEMTVHPKSLADMFAKLRNTTAASFTLEMDTNGALGIGWETKFGSYSAYVPGCRKGRKFETRLIAPMR